MPAIEEFSLSMPHSTLRSTFGACEHVRSLFEKTLVVLLRAQVMQRPRPRSPHRPAQAEGAGAGAGAGVSVGAGAAERAAPGMAGVLARARVPWKRATWTRRRAGMLGQAWTTRVILASLMARQTQSPRRVQSCKFSQQQQNRAFDYYKAPAPKNATHLSVCAVPEPRWSQSSPQGPRNRVSEPR